MSVAPVLERTLFVGLDVGQVRDPSAICVLERLRTFEPGPYEAGYPGRGSWSVSYGIRHLERLKLGTPYPAVVDRVSQVCEKLGSLPAAKLAELVLDMTGVGRPIFDLLNARRFACRVIGVQISAGDRVARLAGETYSVPKRDLVAGLVVMFQSRQLKIAEQLADASVLVNELVNFQQRLSAAGRHSYGNDGRESKNDDYVSAAALCAWRARVRERRELGERNRLW